MDPFLVSGGIIAAAAWLKKRNATNGSAGAAPSMSTEATPANAVGNRMSSSQTPPVSSEMSLGTLDSLTVQKPLQPAAVWNPSGAMSQGSGSGLNDDGRVFLPAIPAKTVAIADVGSVQKWNDLTMTDPAYVAPTVMTAQPLPVSSVTITAPEVAASAPKAESLQQSPPVGPLYQAGSWSMQVEP
jgi:hypothetical protein